MDNNQRQSNVDTHQRLAKVEDKLDAMHDDLVEIKAGLRFATTLVKFISALAALVIAFFSLK